jgi:hypothetical protein
VIHRERNSTKLEQWSDKGLGLGSLRKIKKRFHTFSPLGNRHHTSIPHRCCLVVLAVPKIFPAGAVFSYTTSLNSAKIQDPNMLERLIIPGRPTIDNTQLTTLFQQLESGCSRYLE